MCMSRDDFLTNIYIRYAHRLETSVFSMSIISQNTVN